MNELIERLIEWVSNLPVGLIIFAVAMAFSFFGKDDKEAQQQQQQRQEQASGIPSGDDAPARPIVPADAYTREERPAPAGGHIFASDERRERAERERQQEEVLVFGGLDFGQQGSLFDEEHDDRDSQWSESQWGKTKYGFDDSEWGSEWKSDWDSGFGDKKSPDPIIR